MTKVKNENYVNIAGWMVAELHLKGNELFIYAIIYGFSQAENQSFSGSLQYLADWCNSTKQGVLKNLKSLCEKGLIIKNDNMINGVKFCEYRATEFNGVLNKVEYPIQQSLTGGIKQSLPNNIDRKTSNKSIYIPTLEEVAEYCRERQSGVDPKAFFDYYQSQKWKKSNGQPLYDWKAGVRYWERTQRPSKCSGFKGGVKPDQKVVQKAYEDMLKWNEENGGC